MRFQIEEQTFDLSAGDLLFFPANALYVTRDEGDGDARMLSVGVECEQGWPAESHYWMQQG